MTGIRTFELYPLGSAPWHPRYVCEAVVTTNGGSGIDDELHLTITATTPVRVGRVGVRRWWQHRRSGK